MESIAALIGGGLFGYQRLPFWEAVPLLSCILLAIEIWFHKRGIAHVRAVGMLMATKGGNEDASMTRIRLHQGFLLLGAPFVRLFLFAAVAYGIGRLIPN